MQPPAVRIGEGRRPGRQPGPHILQVPAQDQVKLVQHRDPPRPRPRPLGRLAEPHVDLAERPAVKVQVGDIQRDGFLGPQPGVIQRPVKRVVPPGRGEHPGGGHPLAQEREEPLHPGRGGRRPGLRGVGADMAGGVELIDRVGQPHPEARLDLGGLAGGQEREEPLERRYIPAPGARRHPGRRELTHDPVDVLAGHLPGRAPARVEEPFQGAGAVADGQRAEPAGGLRGLIRLDARRLINQRVRRRARYWQLRPTRLREDPCRPPHTSASPLIARCHLTILVSAWKVKDLRGVSLPQAAGQIPGEPGISRTRT